MTEDRFAVSRGDFVFLPVGTLEERWLDFRDHFRLPEKGGVFYDVTHHPIAISRRFIEGVEHYGDDELRHIAQAIIKPHEIWSLFVYALDGSPMLTRRYIAEIDEGPGVIVVDLNRAGWCFATSQDPLFRLSRLRTEARLWPE